MTVYIDPPIWPAHETAFGHLISDFSLVELHTFAGAAGISPRAFDLDHYDVAAHHYERLVACGAVEVTGRDLARILRDSGLRIKHKDR
ncbi:DUF4031 domain-containing protein [Nesterenkonia populi]|uniref:DUF4031 domain-containing protein n=1 Tax=Nesterenkonia populi TaxID=1591087 RepID=UPI0011BE0836